MGARRNVQEQNDDTRRDVRRLASEFRNNPLKFPWLVETLVARDLDANRGLLIQLNCIPEQEGDLFRGLWLTPSGSFHDFEVMVPRSGAGELEVERWTDVSSEINTSRHNPGTGISLGAIALEVLHELNV